MADLSSQDLPSCTINTLTSVVRKHCIAMVAIHLVDKDGRQTPGQLTASLLLNGENILSTVPEVTNERDGEYTVTYLPGAGGECKLYIFLDGKPLAEPVRVCVKDGLWAPSTPLSGAAQCGHMGFVSQLLDKPDVNVNEMDKDNKTALHGASWQGHVDIVELLIGKGAMVDTVDKSKQTALHKAARGGHVSTVEALLREGAQVDSVDEKLQTPLILAAEGGKSTVVSTLIPKGTNVNITDKSGATALHKAARGGHSETVEVLLREGGALVNTVDENSLTPLMWAACNGHAEVVKALVQHGADVDEQDESSRTALDMAQDRGHTKVIDYLRTYINERRGSLLS